MYLCWVYSLQHTNDHLLIGKGTPTWYLDAQPGWEAHPSGLVLHVASELSCTDTYSSARMRHESTTLK